MPHLTATHLDTAMRECVDECLNCYTSCEATLVHCLELGGKHAEPDHIRLLTDCARICAISADFMIRQSDVHMQICGVCAEVCRRCAVDCERIDPSDKTMKACAEQCRRCAESCEQMAAA
jgi:hypothetical protein